MVCDGEIKKRLEKEVLKKINIDFILGTHLYLVKSCLFS